MNNGSKKRFHRTIVVKFLFFQRSPVCRVLFPFSIRLPFMNVVVLAYFARSLLAN